MALYHPEVQEPAALDALEPWRRATETQPARQLPNGPAAAAILAAGLGSALYGLIVLLAEANGSIHDLMILNESVGPLSGKTTSGMLAWLVVWGALHAVWRKRSLNFTRVFVVALALIGIALLLTFPPFFLLFASE